MIETCEAASAACWMRCKRQASSRRIMVDIFPASCIVRYNHNIVASEQVTLVVYTAFAIILKLIACWSSESWSMT